MNINTTFIKRTDLGYAYNGIEVIGLTPRESQVILLAAHGKKNPEIAQALCCSVNNIKQLFCTLFFKLHAHTRTELITKAFACKALRVLTIMMAFHISALSPWINDYQDQIARAHRVRLRARNTAARIRQGGLVWLPETNQLIIG